MAQTTPARVAPQPDHTSDDKAPPVKPVVAPEPPSERRKMLDRAAEIQARRDSLTEEELAELIELNKKL